MMMNNEISADDDYNHLYKSKKDIEHDFYSNLVVLVGDAGVGKTHLLNR